MTNKLKEKNFNPQPLLINATELGQMLGINLLSVYKWEKKVPNFPKRVYLAPRIFRYRLKDVEKFINSL